MEVEKLMGTFERVWLSNIGRFIPAMEQKRGIPGPQFPDIAAGDVREGYNKKVVFPEIFDVPVN